MLQRGLAILLSVCMLTGGSGNTVYAMNPQADIQTIGVVQNEAEIGEAAETTGGLQEDGEGNTPGNEKGSTEDETDDKGDTTGDETGDKGDTTGDESGDKGDTAEGGEGEDGSADTGDDAPAVSDNDTSTGENDGEDEIEVIEADTLSQNSASLLSMKEEELTLTVDAPQTVTLGAGEQQWLTFTAPGEGIFRFYSTVEDGSYQDKYVNLYHDKNGSEFASDYGSGENGNFNCTYRMDTDETVYLRVRLNNSYVGGTFTVHAEKVTPPEFTVTQNSEGNYTLQSDDYRLNVILTPVYTTVKAAVELRQADGSALTGYNSYRVYYKYSYDNRWGNTYSDSHTEYLDSSNSYKQEYDISGIAAGGKFWISELQLKDGSNNILALLGEGGQEITVNTLTTDKMGVLTEVTAEDASISARPEMVSDQNGRIRYRKKNAEEWTYYKNTIYYYNSNKIEFAADPDTDYVIELTGTDLETVYDTAEVRTKAFAATGITTEVTDITSSGAKIKVTVGSYTGSNQYIRARVSYTDAMGDTQTATGNLYTDSLSSGITLQLSNLAAGTEYKDLEVEIDDTDSYSMEYVAYRAKVSFTTTASALTAEKIAVTVTPDAEDGTKAVLQTKLEGVTEGTYAYTAKYRVAGSKDWTESKTVSGTLNAGNSYTAEQTLTSLMGNTEYDVLVMVDGISKTASFMTAAAAVAANVEVKPLMQGIEVKAALTGVSSGRYRISTYYYDAEQRRWMDSSYYDYNDCFLETDNDWKTTAVLYSSNIRPNTENDWKITIVNYGNSSDKIYEKYMTLEAARQEIVLSEEDIKCTSARIRGKLSTRDESIRYGNANSYYREKGAVQWIEGDSCYYGANDGGTVYLNNLKEDTEYEFKLVPQNYPNDILAQTTFRTLKDTRSLSVSVDNRRYTSAQINWTFNKGANWSNDSSYICIHYREKGDAVWRLARSGWYGYGAAAYTGKESLTGLEQGTTYEVLVELKDTSNSTAGEDVVRKETAEFTTATVDHVLKVEPVAEEIEATSAAFTVQLTKPTGTLENRAKAEVTLTPVNGGDIRSKEVSLNKDNQYLAKLVINNLLPNTKYAVSAELYESESNRWVFLKQYDLGEVTTKAADAPTSLTISEAELLLNKGTSKKLTVTAQPPEAAAGLIWTSSNPTIAAVSRDGNVTAQKAGEADITVTTTGTAADGSEKVSAVCHVTVRDYEIRVKNENGSYDSIPAILSKAQKRTLVVYDNAESVELTDATWTSSNPHTARIDESGLLEPQNYGKTCITAKTTDGITLKTDAITVINEIQGFSITRPKTDHSSYAAIRTAEAVYQVAAGETYRVGCVLSPAYTEQGSSSVNMESSRFNWTSDNAAVSASALADSNLTKITIPQTVSGQVTITAVMKDAEYQDKSFSITLDVLKKPEVENLPTTYTNLNYSNRLVDVGLPENWKWKQQDTLLYESGVKTFTAYYDETGYYPYETDVDVNAGYGYGSLSTSSNWSSKKKAYIVKKGTAVRVSQSVSYNSLPEDSFEWTDLAPAAKDTAKVSVVKAGAEGNYDVTASEKGTYTVSSSLGFKKAAFEKQDGAYVRKEGEKVKDTSYGLRLMAVDTMPIQKINFAVAEDSPEKVTISGEGVIEYEIIASNAATKQKERVIYLDVTAKDTDGSPVESPKIDYKVSDASVVKLKKVGTGRLELTIPKGADGLAKIIATANDDLGRSAQLAIRVKDYTPRVTAYKIAVNENYTYGTQIAQVILPYEKDGNDRIETLSLVETDSQDGTDTVAGLSVHSSVVSGGNYKHNIYLSIADKAQIKQRGNLKYYLAMKTKAYGGLVFVPVQIKLETGMPTVTLKQSGKVNVFYTDTTHLTSYDAVSMGMVEVTSPASIESVRWVAGDGDASSPNTEFVIERSSSSTWKNGKYTKKYMIQQHRPVLNSSKKPLDVAAKGTLFIKLSGYNEEISSPFTVQTVYKKPTLKVADYKVCPAFGHVGDSKSIYTNAAKTNNSMVKGSTSVWRGYSDVLCADEDVEIVENSNVGLRYTGTKNKKTKLTLYSDYWYESLAVNVNIKVVKSKVKLSPATVTLNKAYPTETTQTAAGTWFGNVETGWYVNVSDVGIVGANAAAQQMLDQNLINMDYLNSYLSVSVNYANAMGNNLFKAGSYKYKLTPYYGDTKLNDVTLTVKIIEKNAAVKVRTKGSIDLLKLNWDASGYDRNYSPFVTVTPTFQNLDSSYVVTNAELCGAYKDRFKIANCYPNGTIEILPDSVGRWNKKLTAGKNYTLSVKYTIKDAYGEGGETITVTSNTFNIKPKQSVPKVTSSKKQLTLYACAEGSDKGDTMYLYVPHDPKKGYYAIDYAYGYLDVNKDGRTDIYVERIVTSPENGRATIKVYVADADAVKAAAKGTAYKIPVTVRCKGSDGVSKNASTTVSVLVKK